jgi:glycosyltransferase involved in cell wall biosynthesis
MADRGGGGPTVAFVREPGAPLVAALLEDLGRQGWRARVLDRAPLVGGRVDVLHVPSAALAREWVRVARRLGAHTVVSVRGDEAAALEPAAWTGADALHADSERLAKVVANGAGSQVVIEPPADPVLLAEEPVEPPAGAPLRLLSVGALSWTQGYEFALAAVALAAERGVRCEYRIVGTGPHRDAVAFARHQLGLDASVELVGPASRDELRDHLRWAGVLVDMSVLAPSAQALVDAQAAGVPVVATQDDVPGALAVPARDSAAVCEAFVTLAGDADLRARLGRAGRERARAAPTPEAHGARWRELYRELASA